MDNSAEHEAAESDMDHRVRDVEAIDDRVGTPASSPFASCRKHPGRGIWANRRFKSCGAWPPGFDHPNRGM